MCVYVCACVHEYVYVCMRVCAYTCVCVLLVFFHSPCLDLSEIPAVGEVTVVV